MAAAVRHTMIGGFEAVVLENPRLRAVILPTLGGRVWELHDRVRHRQWIWHREGVPLTTNAPTDAYDDVWTGGWEELFPNDAPGRFEGRDLPDHGAWWTMRWDSSVNVTASAAEVRLTGTTTAPRTHCVKTIALPAETGRLRISYRIESQEPVPFHFLFKQHLPVAISPSCRLMLPGGAVTPVDPGFGTILPGRGPYRWPWADGVDLSRIPPSSMAAREFLYVADLPAAWCGVEDRGAGASLRLDFDAGTTPYLWLFLSYGGWRDCYTAVLEPCTNLPKDLGDAVRAGQSARLESEAGFETVVTVTLGSGEAAA